MTRNKSKDEKSIYRFMCVKTDDYGYHIDFNSKEDAITYAEKLNDSKIEWYGIYELNPKYDYWLMVTHKRLIQHNNLVHIKKDSKVHHKSSNLNK